MMYTKGMSKRNAISYLERMLEITMNDLRHVNNDLINIQEKLELQELNNEMLDYGINVVGHYNGYDVFKEGMVTTFNSIDNVKKWFDGYKDGVDINISIECDCFECPCEECNKEEPKEPKKVLNSKKSK